MPCRPALGTAAGTSRSAALDFLPPGIRERAADADSSARDVSLHHASRCAGMGMHCGCRDTGRWSIMRLQLRLLHGAPNKITRILGPSAVRCSLFRGAQSALNVKESHWLDPSHVTRQLYSSTGMGSEPIESFMAGATAYGLLATVVHTGATFRPR